MRGARWSLLLLALGLSIQLLGKPATGQESPPNILVILTDDQRAAGTVTQLAMPATRRWLRDSGTRFPNAFATTPLCCPSRASIYTGQYAHNHGVRLNDDAPKLDHTDTVQRYLGEAGYQTGIVGKYLNRWPIEEPPPFFERYALLDPPAYWGAQANEDGHVRQVSRYSTDYIAARARALIRDFEVTDQTPWMLFVQTNASHPPYQPERAYADVPVGRWNGNPAVAERNLKDKPPYVRNAKNPVTLEEGREIRRRQLRTLMSVDDLVQLIFQTLAHARELGRTLVFFLSDNGFMWGEHGQRAKAHSYTHSVAIPFFVRWPGHLEPGTVDPRLVANIDVAPTILDAAGVVPSHEVDGRSLLEPFSRTHLFLEFFNTPPTMRIPPWASSRTTAEQYVEYYSGDPQRVVFREYYDLQADPWELRNLLRDGDPSNNPASLGLIQAQVDQGRGCYGTVGPEACP
jgi:arylsulfatase A-like enzyme